MQNIDVFILAESLLEEEIGKVTDVFKDNFYFNLIDVTTIKELNNDKTSEIVIIEEEDSYLYSVDVFDKILSLYSIRPAIIIASSNKDIFNVVRWMRKGASDYILTNTINEELLTNSIKGAINFFKNKMPVLKDANETSDYINEKVTIPANINWDTVADNKYYNMSLLYISIVFDKETIARYSKESLENLSIKIKTYNTCAV